MTVAKLDLLNIGLMLAALGLAVARPYEAFLLAFAFIGPLHYLTEISWLHDRRSFCAHRGDAFFLVLPVVFVFLGFNSLREAVGWNYPFFAAISPELLLFAFLSAFILLKTGSAWKRFLWLLPALGATVAFHFAGALRYWFMLYLPTLVHVFIFTGVFIFLGALRSRSRTGILSLGVFIAAAAFCFVNPLQGPSCEPGAWARRNYTVFVPMTAGLCSLFGLRATDFADVEAMYRSPAALRVTSFIAFAYLYHYFNWFSKTGLIGWHRVSWKRGAAILAAWLASAGLYAWSYSAGWIWLALLSLAHVTLEFPLNWLSMKESAARLWGWAPAAFPGRAGASEGSGPRPATESLSSPRP